MKKSESGPTMTDLNETLFIHKSPIEDLKGRNFSHLALFLKQAMYQLSQTQPLCLPRGI